MGHVREERISWDKHEQVCACRDAGSQTTEAEGASMLGARFPESFHFRKDRGVG